MQLTGGQSKFEFVSNGGSLSMNNENSDKQVIEKINDLPRINASKADLKNHSKRINEIEKRINITFKKIEVPALEKLKSARINNWASLIINTAVDSQADRILRKVNGQFKHLNKEDILKRLITTQLDHLKIQEVNRWCINKYH